VIHAVGEVIPTAKQRDCLAAMVPNGDAGTLPRWARFAGWSKSRLTSLSLAWETSSADPVLSSSLRPDGRDANQVPQAVAVSHM